MRVILSIVMALSLIGCATVRTFDGPEYTPEPETIEEVLDIMVDDLNKKRGMKNGAMVLDGARVDGRRVTIYVLTPVTAGVDMPKAFIDKLQKEMIVEACANEHMQAMFVYRISIAYVYKDQGGNVLATVVLTASDCELLEKGI